MVVFGEDGSWEDRRVEALGAGRAAAPRAVQAAAGPGDDERDPPGLGFDDEGEGQEADWEPGSDDWGLGRDDWELGTDEDGALLEAGYGRSIWEAAIELVPPEEERSAPGDVV